MADQDRDVWIRFKAFESVLNKQQGCESSDILVGRYHSGGIRSAQKEHDKLEREGMKQFPQNRKPIHVSLAL